MSVLEAVRPETEIPSIRQEVSYVTPARAARWLVECPYEGQRRVDPSFVLGLVDALKSNQWQVREIQFAHTRLGPDQLIDGRHGLTAISQSGIGAWCKISWQEFDSQDEIDHAYSRIDAGRPRGMGDALLALGVGKGRFERKGDVARLSAAVSLMQTRFLGFGAIPSMKRAEMRLRNRDVKAALCADWMPEMEEFVTITDKPLKRLSPLFRLSGLTAVALITLRYQKKKATDFWNEVAQTVTLSHDSPILALRDILKGDRTSRGGPYVARVTANAWDAWYNNTARAKLGVKDTRSIISITGTPYAGTRIPDIGELPTPGEWENNRRRYFRTKAGDKAPDGGEEKAVLSPDEKVSNP